MKTSELIDEPKKCPKCSFKSCTAMGLICHKLMIHKISKENTPRQESKIIEKTFDNQNERSDLNCPKCNLSTNFGETINCNNCNKWYHFTCVNIKSNDPWVKYEEIPYYCSKCEAPRNVESPNLLGENQFFAVEEISQKRAKKDKSKTFEKEENITKVLESQVKCSNCNINFN